MSKLLEKNNINLLALNLQRPSAINIAVYGMYIINMYVCILFYTKTITYIYVIYR